VYFGSSPYSKCAAVGKPSGFTDPANPALELDDTVGAEVLACGAPGFAVPGGELITAVSVAVALLPALSTSLIVVVTV
jgi:hypothetical protein